MILEEYFLQGDIEREMNLDISPMCDRFHTNIPESQVYFINSFVLPMFKSLEKIAPRIRNCIESTLQNISRWEAMDQ